MKLKTCVGIEILFCAVAAGFALDPNCVIAIGPAGSGYCAGPIPWPLNIMEFCCVVAGSNVMLVAFQYYAYKRNAEGT